MGNKNYHFDTKRIHAGYSAEEHLNAVDTPIYQTAAFNLIAKKDKEYKIFQITNIQTKIFDNTNIL